MTGWCKRALPVACASERARREGYAPGQQRAFATAKVLQHARVVIVGSDRPDVVSACKIVPLETIEGAPAMAAQQLGTDLDVLLVPRALLCLPVVVAPAAPLANS